MKQFAPEEIFRSIARPRNGARGPADTGMMSCSFGGRPMLQFVSECDDFVFDLERGFQRKEAALRRKVETLNDNTA